MQSVAHISWPFLLRRVESVHAVLVTVTMPRRPQWVRFQYRDFPQCGLYNAQGLPVLPFLQPVDALVRARATDGGAGGA